MAVSALQVEGLSHTDARNKAKRIVPTDDGTAPDREPLPSALALLLAQSQPLSRGRTALRLANKHDAALPIRRAGHFRRSQLQEPSLRVQPALPHGPLRACRRKHRRVLAQLLRGQHSRRGCLQDHAHHQRGLHEDEKGSAAVQLQT